MWRPNDKFRSNWDFYVMLCAVWNCFSLPFDVAFEPEVMDGTFFSILNAFIDFSFAVDIVISFRTTYFDSRTGDEVTNHKKIARNYLKSRFWIDLIATIPVDTIAEWITGGNTDVSTL